MRTGRFQETERVEALRRRIDRWRRTRESRTAMPADLWAEAVALARDAGQPCRIARAVGVDAGSLTRQVAGAGRGPASVRAPGPARFVELRGMPLLGASASPGIVVEVTNVEGARLTVRIGAGEGFDVAAVVRGFCERRA
jgi:hypothetical protein